MGKNKFRTSPPPPPDHIVKLEFKGVVKAENIKLYQALFEALSQIIQ